MTIDEIAGGLPGLGRAAVAAQIVGGRGQEPEQRLERLERRVAEERELEDVVVVEQPRGFDDRLLLGQRQSGDEQRLRRDAEGERGAGRCSGGPPRPAA